MPDTYWPNEFTSSLCHWFLFVKLTETQIERIANATVKIICLNSPNNHTYSYYTDTYTIALALTRTRTHPLKFLLYCLHKYASSHILFFFPQVTRIDARIHIHIHIQTHILMYAFLNRPIETHVFGYDFFALLTIACQHTHNHNRYNATTPVNSDTDSLTLIAHRNQKTCSK